MADISQVKLPNGDTYNLVDETSGYIKNYTETDPVFSASAAAGITSTDISNWNAKVSDTGKWNNKSLSISTTTGNDFYVPRFNSTSAGTAYLTLFTATPAASCGVRYDGSAYIYSTTPSANDNSTKVATTAYVDAAIPDTSGFVSKSGDTMSGRLTLNYNSVLNNNGLLINFNDNYGILIECTGGNYSDSDAIARLNFKTVGTSNGVQLRGIATPNINTDAANKKYVDDSIPKVYSSTNTGGYLTMATLPIYDGTVE